MAKRRDAGEPVGSSRSAEHGMLDRISDGLFALDSQWRFSFINDEAARVFRRRREDLIGKQIWTEIPELVGRPFHASCLDSVRTLHTTSFEANFLDPDKTFICHLYPSSDGLTVIVHDGTDEKHRADWSDHERGFLSALMNTLPDHVYFKDLASRFLKISKSMANAFGLNHPEEANGKTDFDFFTEQHASPAFEDEKKILRTGVPIVGMEEKESWPDGHETWVSTTKAPLRNANGELIGTFGISQDITKRKLAEARLKSMSRIHGMTSQINQAIIHATRREDLFQEVCDISVTTGGFAMAWIGMLEGDGRRPVPVAQCGADNRFLRMICESFGSQRSEHPLLQRLLAGEHYVANNILADFKGFPWLDDAVRMEYASCAALPILHDGVVTGCLVVNSSQAEFFDDEEAKLLDEISTEISFAVDNIEKESQRKAARESLRETIYWMNESQKAGRIGSYVTDFLTGYWKSSEVLDEIFGINTEYDRSVNGWMTIVHPEDREEMNSYLQEIIARQVSFDKEYRIVRIADREERWVHGLGHTVFDDHGKLLKMIGTIQDITDRKRSEEAIALHARALESAANAIIITDRNGTILSVNPAFTRYTGYSAAEVIGKKTSILNSGVQPRSFYEDFWKTITSGHVWQGELVNKRKDGTLYNEEMMVTPVLNSKGYIAYFIAIKQDLTETKRLRAEVAQMQKLESVGTLASGIAHDFNNILGIIMGYVSLIDRDPGTRPQSIATINTALKRGASLVRQILTFARKTETKFGSLELNVLLKEITKMLKETFPSSIEISFEAGKDIPEINADASQIHQAVLNLCVNARDAMPNGGKLKLRTSMVEGAALRSAFPSVSAGRYVHLSVSDSGPGMDEAVQAKVFDPFFTTKEKGTGLGLSVVYGVVREHNGFVNLDSKLGEGSTFNLYFPIPEAGKSEGGDAAGQDQPAQGGNETLLLVEDELSYLEMLRAVCEASGYKVLVAADGMQALETYRLHKDEIDLVITDMGLPKMTGDRLFAEMKKLNPGVKVILASGFLEPDAKTAILKAGVKRFVQKPYFPDDVLKQIRDVLDR